MEQTPQVEKYSYIDKPKRKKLVIAVNVLCAIVIILLLAVLIIFKTTLTTITVDGKSMFPTLVDGDRLILLTHGYKIDRGDIVVFKRDGHNNVKRVIGLEGDIIQFDLQNMTWIVNGTPCEENYIEGGYSDNYFNMTTSDYKSLLFSDEGYAVEKGQIFVLGDNRNIQGGGISLDSHVYGNLNVENIIGKVIKIY